MTPRERMRRFYAGETIDRIPNGLGGCETAGMHLLAPGADQQQRVTMPTARDSQRLELTSPPDIREWFNIRQVGGSGPRR